VPILITRINHNTLTAGGSSIKNSAEDFHYLYKKISGDFILTADIKSNAQFSLIAKEFGWMIRSSLTNNSEQISACQNESGAMYLQWRRKINDSIRNPENIILFPKKNMQTIQLERSGNSYTMRVANFGEPLQVIGTQELKELKDDVFVGLFVKGSKRKR